MFHSLRACAVVVASSVAIGVHAAPPVKMLDEFKAEANLASLMCSLAFRSASAAATIAELDPTPEKTAAATSARDELAKCQTERPDKMRALSRTLAAKMKTAAGKKAVADAYAATIAAVRGVNPAGGEEAALLYRDRQARLEDALQAALAQLDLAE